jgi:hypothetical protein
VNCVALMAPVLAGIKVWLEVLMSSVVQVVEAVVSVTPLESSSEGTEA